MPVKRANGEWVSPVVADEARHLDHGVRIQARHGRAIADVEHEGRLLVAGNRPHHGEGHLVVATAVEVVGVPLTGAGLRLGSRPCTSLPVRRGTSSQRPPASTRLRSPVERLLLLEQKLAARDPASTIEAMASWVKY